MPNTFAYIVFLSWPIVIFFLLKRYGVGAGALISLLTAYMFLPASFSLNIPGPDLDKFLITSLTIFLYIILNKKTLGIKYLDTIFKILFFISIFSPFLTALTNQESYQHIPGLSLYDGLTNSLISLLEFLPFFIGLSYFRTEKQHLILFKYFALSTFIYSFLVLFEIRMSPQFHNWIYGYFPHDWSQQNRGGGFRAVVFMGHGLLVAMFLALGVAFWASLIKSKYKAFRYSNAAGLFLVLTTLILSKSLAALVYGLLAVVLIIQFKPKFIYLISAMLAVIFITYPISSATGLFPHKNLVDIATVINQDRADSLAYRFRHEDILLARASEKPWFGWGTWGRNRVYDEDTGEDLTVTDGQWIITLGSSGWVGFLSTYLFLFLPIWMVFRRNRAMRFASQQNKILLSAHCLIVGLLMIDQLPNSSFNPLYWCLAGSLLGRMQVLLMESSSLSKGRILNQKSYT